MCGDKNYLDAIVISVMSIAAHTNRPINLIFYTMDLSHINSKFNAMNDDCGKYLENILKRKNSLSKVKIIDCSKEFLKKGGLIECVNLKTHFTPYTMLCRINIYT